MVTSMTYLVLLRGSWQNNDVGPLPVGALAVVVGQPVVPVLGLGLDLLESALTELHVPYGTVNTAYFLCIHSGHTIHVLRSHDLKGHKEATTALNSRRPRTLLRGCTRRYRVRYSSTCFIGYK